MSNLSGDLSKWAQEGVLLLNTVLTVERKQPNSHKDKGWEIFTDAIIGALNDRLDPVIFVLWGSHAQKKKALISGKQHIILQAPHPSPLSAYRGFFGSKPYSQINTYLEKMGKKPIDWALE